MSAESITLRLSSLQYSMTIHDIQIDLQSTKRRTQYKAKRSRRQADVPERWSLEGNVLFYLQI